MPSPIFLFNFTFSCYPCLSSNVPPFHLFVGGGGQKPLQLFQQKRQQPGMNQIAIVIFLIFIDLVVTVSGKYKSLAVVEVIRKPHGYSQTELRWVPAASQLSGEPCWHWRLSSLPLLRPLLQVCKKYPIVMKGAEYLF